MLYVAYLADSETLFSQILARKPESRATSTASIEDVLATHFRGRASEINDFRGDLGKILGKGRSS